MPIIWGKKYKNKPHISVGRDMPIKGALYPESVRNGGFITQNLGRVSNIPVGKGFFACLEKGLVNF